MDRNLQSLRNVVEKEAERQAEEIIILDAKVSQYKQELEDMQRYYQETLFTLMDKFPPNGMWSNYKDATLSKGSLYPTRINWGDGTFGVTKIRRFSVSGEWIAGTEEKTKRLHETLKDKSVTIEVFVPIYLVISQYPKNNKQLKSCKRLKKLTLKTKKGAEITV